MKERIGMENLFDLNLSGIGSAAGGRYRSVVAEGIGTVEGSVEAEKIRMNGVSTVHGDVRATIAELEGVTRIDGGLIADVCRLNGYTHIKGSVGGEQLTVNGMFKVAGNCEVERFYAEGVFRIGGMLNAGTIEMKLQGKGEAVEIGGDSIKVGRVTVIKWKELFMNLFKKWKPRLQAETIEADQVELAYTTASFVRGNRVVIGPDCHVGLVEYRSELRVHPSAIVEKEAKIGG
jgi:cytoskeletal protein CcmA (bactofilin family)